MDGRVEANCAHGARVSRSTFTGFRGKNRLAAGLLCIESRCPYKQDWTNGVARHFFRHTPQHPAPNA